jgi:hypothetical protein
MKVSGIYHALSTKVHVLASCNATIKLSLGKIFRPPSITMARHQTLHPLTSSCNRRQRIDGVGMSCLIFRSLLARCICDALGRGPG